MLGPRFGAAYDLTGNQSLIFRGGGGLFYDRPDGNTVFSIPGNPPIATSQDLRNGQLQNVGTGGGLQTIGVPGLVTFQYDAKVPASVQWNGGRPDDASLGVVASTSPTSATMATTASAASRAATP